MKPSTIIAGIILLSGSISAQASVYHYEGVVTQCTVNCGSVAALDVGSLLGGSIDIDVAPNSLFGNTEVNAFLFSITNPSIATSGPGDPGTDNPLYIDSFNGKAASNGSYGGTNTDNDLDSGEIKIQFLNSALETNGVYVVFDLATGNGQACTFYLALQCNLGQFAVFEGSFTQAAVPVPPAIWLFASGLVGLAGISRRKKA